MRRNITISLAATRGESARRKITRKAGKTMLPTDHSLLEKMLRPEPRGLANPGCHIISLTFHRPSLEAILIHRHIIMRDNH